MDAEAVKVLKQIEGVDAELNSFIEKKAREANAIREVEEMWAQSVRRYHGKRREKEASEWLDYRSRIGPPRSQATSKGRGR